LSISLTSHRGVCGKNPRSSSLLLPFLLLIFFFCEGNHALSYYPVLSSLSPRKMTIRSVAAALFPWTWPPRHLFAASFSPLRGPWVRPGPPTSKNSVAERTLVARSSPDTSWLFAQDFSKVPLEESPQKTATALDFPIFSLIGTPPKKGNELFLGFSSYVRGLRAIAMKETITPPARFFRSLPVGRIPDMETFSFRTTGSSFLRRTGDSGEECGVCC